MIAIGDIHGCYDELVRLIDKLPVDRELIFIGDYVDRGPKSMQVLDYLIELQQQRPCIFLRGNHEELMLEANPTGGLLGARDAYYSWMLNGGGTTSKSYGDTPDRLYDHLEWIDANTKFYHETDEFFFVHAGIDPTMTVAEAKLATAEFLMVWDRSHWGCPAHKLKWEKTVVCGHTIKDAPVIEERRIGIDTGAFLPYMGKPGGALTAILLPEREIVQTHRISTILRS